MADGAGANGDRKLRVAALGDLHCRGDCAKYRELAKIANGEADVLVLCGDLTDRGLVDEAKALADALTTLTIPCAAVLGNHDFDHDAAKTVQELLTAAGVHVLDGDHVIVADGALGIAGVKGFAGGFGSGTLQAFGEGPIKAFVQEAVNESLKLESALGQLDTPKRVVIMHYAPVAETTNGENVEIRAYLGSSRLAAPVDTYGADVVFHGHAHHGTLEGKTNGGVPVYNVAQPVVRRTLDKPLFILEL